MILSLTKEMLLRINNQFFVCRLIKTQRTRYGKIAAKAMITTDSSGRIVFDEHGNIYNPTGRPWKKVWVSILKKPPPGSCCSICGSTRDVLVHNRWGKKLTFSVINV